MHRNPLLVRHCAAPDGSARGIESGLRVRAPHRLQPAHRSQIIRLLCGLDRSVVTQCHAPAPAWPARPNAALNTVALMARARAVGGVLTAILLIRPDEISISVRAEPVEALERAQGDRFKL